MCQLLEKIANKNKSRLYFIKKRHVYNKWLYLTAILSMFFIGNSQSVYAAKVINKNVKVNLIENSIRISWDKLERVETYEVEADGQVISNIVGLEYKDLKANIDNEHKYRIRGVIGVNMFYLSK